MLQDTVRVDTYAAAIKAAVKPGMVVVDAGTGSGVLAVMAAKAGATVYAIDNTDVLDLAKEVVAASGVADKVTLIRGDFSTAEIPQLADIVVTETFGALALAEGAARDLQAGCKRWLKPGGRVLPGIVDLWFAPIGSADVFARSVEVFDIKHGVDLRPLRSVATTRGATLSVTAEELAAPGALAMSLAFPRDEGGQGQITVRVDGPVYGMVGWFSLGFGEDAVLPTGPSDPHTHWRQVVLPWATPMELSGTLVATFTVAPDPSDRRGLEVACKWSCGDQTGTTMHRVR
jgi:SAM-dependent methyltransferase